MVKIKLPHNSWAYEDFISEEERCELVDWMNSCFHLARENGSGRYFFSHAEKLNNLPKSYLNVKKRLMKLENLKDEDPRFGDFISFNFEGAQIHPHKDPNVDNKIHTRYNLLLSVPESGGEPIYGGEMISIKEKMIWRCEAGKYFHESLPVVGQKPRLNISFGFLV